MSRLPPAAWVVVAAGCLVVAVVVVLVVGVPAVRAARAASAQRSRLAAALEQSGAEVAALAAQVAALTERVERVDDVRGAPEPREYVITSLGSTGVPAGAAPAPVLRSRRGVGARVEELVLGALLAGRDGAPPRRGVDLAVRAVAAVHGVRRALSPDVLDRAAAEAHVARRRSRRLRRREVREARRHLRAVRAEQDHAA